MIDVKDRVIQYPSRYELDEVSAGVYDLTQVTGTVTEEGTAVNKTLFDSIKTDIEQSQLASYMSFCGNVNQNMLEASMGFRNETLVRMLGKQIAMYSWFKGDSKITYPFTNLITCDTIDDIAENSSAIAEIIANTNTNALIDSIPYAVYRLKRTQMLYDFGTINVLAGDFTQQYVNGSGYTFTKNSDHLYLLATATSGSKTLTCGATSMINVTAYNKLYFLAYADDYSGSYYTKLGYDANTPCDNSFVAETNGLDYTMWKIYSFDISAQTSINPCLKVYNYDATSGREREIKCYAIWLY